MNGNEIKNIKSDIALEEVKTYTRDEVISALAKARVERKVDINSIMMGMGYVYLSSVPAEKYGELLKRAGCV